MIKRVEGFPAPQTPIPSTMPLRPQQGPGFNELLQTKLKQSEPLRWSAHAQERLSASRIELSSSDLVRLNEAVQKASEKGARESLILMDNLALVVSIKNRTVITAIASDRLKENVFTNIDSAVIT